jgi:hypothetical protein
MLMVVFGAGASYDAIPSFPPGTSPLEMPYYDKNNRMPLADHLFEDRANFVEVLNEYKECHPVVPYLRNRISGKSVEQVLQGLLAEADQYPQGRKQLAAIRYYLQSMIYHTEDKWWRVGNGVTNHITLLDQIQRWRQRTKEPVCFVTFNYDTLIERALRTIGIDFNYPADYINHMDYKLIKLHGSITWGRVVRGPIQSHDKMDIAHEVIKHIDEITISQTYDTVGSYPPREQNGVVWFPAIAIPVEIKDAFECPSEHVTKLKEMIPQIDKILIIGWRATEQPFLQLLAEGLKRPVKGLIVAGDEAEALTTFANIKQAMVEGDFVPSPHKGFTDFIVNRTIDGFLSE